MYMVRCLHPNMMACVLISLNPHNHQVCEHFMDINSANGKATQIKSFTQLKKAANMLLKYMDTISPIPLNALGNPNDCL